jgi:8-oxo-dGTP pyrophosphatase MutT (NUDIX family)
MPVSRLNKLRQCEQVAAVCYHLHEDDIEFLLVRTRDANRWTFPKGSTERGLTHAQAAALEAFEEAGVHGRMEEASFARYIHQKRGGKRKSASRTIEFTVDAYLCEVLRLGSPKESNRNRTWFSATDAKLRLREGRQASDAAELARVVDRAVTRIERLSNGSSVTVTAQQHALTDALQKVQFEAVVRVRGYTAGTPRIPRAAQPLGDLSQSLAADMNVKSQKLLLGEVLQFSPNEKKKPRTLQ